MATWSAGLDALLHDASLVYLGLFLAALIDATGFPFPGRALLVAAGAATAEDWGQVALMTAAGALGAVVGDHLWYAAGRLGAGDQLTRLYCKLSLASGRCEARARSRFDRFGPLAIVIGRFVAGVRLFAAPMAGGGAISYPRFLLFELIGGVVLGILLGQVRFLSDVLGPYIKAMNALPRIVLGSIFVVWLGLGSSSKVMLAAVLVFFVVFFLGVMMTGVKG